MVMYDIPNRMGISPRADVYCSQTEYYLAFKVILCCKYFRKGYSCENVLLHFVESAKSALDDKKHAGAVMMDLSRAFDCLPQIID